MYDAMCHGMIWDRNIVLFREEDEEEDVEKEWKEVKKDAYRKKEC